MGTVNPQQRKPGQSGYVQQGASCSSPRLALPSFSTEEDDDDDDEEEAGDTGEKKKKVIFLTREQVNVKDKLFKPENNHVSPLL